MVHFAGDQLAAGLARARGAAADLVHLASVPHRVDYGLRGFHLAPRHPLSPSPYSRLAQELTTGADLPRTRDEPGRSRSNLNAQISDIEPATPGLFRG